MMGAVATILQCRSKRKVCWYHPVFTLDDYIVEWSPKYLWKLIPADVKANKKTRNKRSGGCILQIFIRCTFKDWNIM